MPPQPQNTNSNLAVPSDGKEGEFDLKFKRRKSVSELMQSGVLKAPADTMERDSKDACRNFQEIGLSDFLSKRPGYLELLRKKLIQDTMTWSTPPNLPTGFLERRNLHSTTVVGDNVYIIGGYAVPRVQNPFVVFNHKTNAPVNPVVLVTEESESPSLAPSYCGSDSGISDNPDEAVVRVSGMNGVAPVSLYRFSHTTVAADSTLFVFGGNSGQLYLNDLWACTTDLKDESGENQMVKWVKLDKANAPSPRGNHSAVMLGNQMYIFGGRDQGAVFNDLYIFHKDEMRWEKVSNSINEPAPRAGHSMVLIDNKLVVFGGYGQDHAPRNDLAVFDTEQKCWLPTPKVKGTPPRARTGHSAAVIHKTKMLIFGGGFWDKVYNDLHLFDLSDYSWSRPADTGSLPAPRAGASVARIDDRLMFYGGGDDKETYKDVFLLDTAFFAAAIAGQYPSPRATRTYPNSATKGKKKRRSSTGKGDKRHAEDSPSRPRRESTEQRVRVQADTIKRAVDTLSSDIDTTVNSIQCDIKSALPGKLTVIKNSIEAQVQKGRGETQLYHQHFLSLINAISVTHETELRNLAQSVNKIEQEVKVFQDGVQTQLTQIKDSIGSFIAAASAVHVAHPTPQQMDKFPQQSTPVYTTQPVPPSYQQYQSPAQNAQAAPSPFAYQNMTYYDPNTGGVFHAPVEVATATPQPVYQCHLDSPSFTPLTSPYPSWQQPSSVFTPQQSPNVFTPHQSPNMFTPQQSPSLYPPQSYHPQISPMVAFPPPQSPWVAPQAQCLVTPTPKQPLNPAAQGPPRPAVVRNPVFPTPPMPPVNAAQGKPPTTPITKGLGKPPTTPKGGTQCCTARVGVARVIPKLARLNSIETIVEEKPEQEEKPAESYSGQQQKKAAATPQQEDVVKAPKKRGANKKKKTLLNFFGLKKEKTGPDAPAQASTAKPKTQQPKKDSHSSSSRTSSRAKSPKSSAGSAEPPAQEPKKLWSHLLSRRTHWSSSSRKNLKPTKKSQAQGQTTSPVLSRNRSLSAKSTVSDTDIINSGEDLGWGELSDKQTFTILKNSYNKLGKEKSPDAVPDLTEPQTLRPPDRACRHALNWSSTFEYDSKEFTKPTPEEVERALKKYNLARHVATKDPVEKPPPSEDKEE